MGAIQHTSKQFHIRIMKNFRQQFKIAITHIGWLDTDKHQFCQSSQQSRHRPKLTGHTKCARQSGHRKHYGVLQALDLQTVKQITALVTDCMNMNVLIEFKIMRKSNSKQLSRYNLLNTNNIRKEGS